MVLLLIVSDVKNRPLLAKHVAFGEIGLDGEVCRTQRGSMRLLA